MVWKSLSSLRRDGIEVRGSVRNIRASSAYKLSLNLLFPLVYPFMSMLFLILWTNGSIARANMSGDRGQPCLVPLLRGKKSEL